MGEVVVVVDKVNHAPSKTILLQTEQIDRMQKVNVLEGCWSGDAYAKVVRPELHRLNISALRYTELPLTQLYSEGFWGSLRSMPPAILTLDHRYWLYDNDIFVDYVNKAASVPITAICMFESPLGYERPDKMPLKHFQKLLLERSEIFHNIVRTRQPKAKILSPAIRVTNPETQSLMLEYFIHSRSLFDGYSVHCCREVTDHSLGALTGFLNEVLRVLRKPVWVTKWGVPSCDFKITSSKMITPTEWNPLQERVAALKLKTMYKSINEVAGKDTQWFYVGSGADVYHPDMEVPRWSTALPFQSDDPKSTWEDFHFLGLVDYKGELKSNLFDALVEIAHAT